MRVLKFALFASKLQMKSASLAGFYNGFVRFSPVILTLKVTHKSTLKLCMSRIFPGEITLFFFFQGNTVYKHKLN